MVSVITTLALLFPISFAPDVLQKRQRVIMIAVDGVREKEAEPLKIKRQGFQSTWYSNCSVSQPYNISLPAYATMFSGYAQKNIRTNYFKGALARKTLFEQYSSELYSAWPNIKWVMGDESKATIVSGSVYEYEDERIFQAYIKNTRRPQFTFLHFGDSDEFAHIGKWHDYLNSIKNARHYIHKIVTENEQHEPNITTYIILTDHGRGSYQWRNHGVWFPASRFIWVNILSPHYTPLYDCSHIGVNNLVKTILNKTN